MGLRVAAVFASLVEAQVARSALRAVGIDAQVFDDCFGTMMWVEQAALGGFRVAVPLQQVVAAQEYLQSINRAPFRRRPDPRSKGVGWRILALVAGLGLGADFGWLVVALRRRRRPPFAELSAIALSLALLAAAGLCLTFVDLLLYDLAHPP
jgi:hypothetical protein